MGVSGSTGKRSIRGQEQQVVQEQRVGKKTERRTYSAGRTGTRIGPTRQNPHFSRTERARNGAPGGHFATADRDAKRRGELVEMMFMVKASQEGLAVAKPYGDSRRYDFIADGGRRLWRVQVKSSAYPLGRGYRINATARRHSREVYSAREIDFLIGYVVPRNVWYVVPVAALSNTTFNVYPDGCRRGGRYEKYREAWRQLGGRKA